MAKETCNTTELHGREPCGARPSYVVILSNPDTWSGQRSGLVFACKRHITYALDARLAEVYTEQREAHPDRPHPPPGIAQVWAYNDWKREH